MKLLIITQVLDTNHPILGFFHRWIEEFAKHCTVVHVIALQVGAHNLPSNVKVHSLGKEEGESRLKYLWRFYRLIWSLRHEYDDVFVHMNQIYVILGAPLWRLLGKKIGLWYTHGAVSGSLKLAVQMANVIFTASPKSLKINTNKSFVTGHGIDTNIFLPNININKEYDLVTVGRISAIKNLETLVDVSKEINKDKPLKFLIIGGTLTNDDKIYESKLIKYIDVSGLTTKITFSGPITQCELPNLLNKSKVFVTAAKNGSLDKAMLEAMSCGLPVVSMAPGSKSLPLGKNQVENVAEFCTQLYNVLDSETFVKDDHVIFIRANHSLSALIPKIISNFS